jgi:hypothetical protein
MRELRDRSNVRTITASSAAAAGSGTEISKRKIKLFNLPRAEISVADHDIFRTDPDPGIRASD